VHECRCDHRYTDDKRGHAEQDRKRSRPHRARALSQKLIEFLVAERYRRAQCVRRLRLLRARLQPSERLVRRVSSNSALRAELNGTSGNEYDLERIYKDAVDLRELLEITTLEDGLLVEANRDPG